MSQSANVLSVAVLEQFRAALQAFAAEAKDVLYEVESEIRRTGDWLDDQLRSWQNEVRRGEDQVFQAKQELARRKMMRVGDRPLDCTEQEEALQLARERLHHAEEQVEQTRLWIRDLPHAITDYESRARQLMGLLEGDLPRACALLNRKAESLASYLTLKVASPSPGSVAAGEPPPPSATPETERKQS